MLSIILQTERLLLRPLVAADISRFVPLLNDFDVSKNLAAAPYPYTEDDGYAFVVKASNSRAVGTGSSRKTASRAQPWCSAIRLD